MYKHVIFDMDGTLIDSFWGICHAYQYAFSQMGHPFPGKDFVKKAIGAPLTYALEALAGVEEKEIPVFLRLYRDYYKEHGKKECSLYPGIRDCLWRLRQAGCLLGTATLKKESFAVDILKEQNILSCMDAVCGINENDCLHKRDLILNCMDQLGGAPWETILVGDSFFDAEGAAEAGIAFLAVTYGFGFQEKKSLDRYPTVGKAEHPKEIADILLGKGR